MSTREKIFNYIKNNKKATPIELIDHFLIGRVMVHRHLKRLMNDGYIKKEGSAPRVFYVVDDTEVSKTDYDFTKKEVKYLEDNFLYITAIGERKVGVGGFVYWCDERNLQVADQVKKYQKITNKYQKLQKGGLYDASSKLKSSFDRVCVDKLFYIDFNSIEIFGKTKLGQMLLYAKQGQDRKEMRKIAQEIEGSIKRFIKEKKIDSIIFVPPTVKREHQFMKVLEKELKINLPKIDVIKKSGEVVVPQKTLKKLSDRKKNAEATFEIISLGNFKRVLIIDDAVGSGSTINEIACKVKDKKMSKQVFGISIVGSLNGFDVISEV